MPSGTIMMMCLKKGLYILFQVSLIQIRFQPVAPQIMAEYTFVSICILYEYFILITHFDKSTIFKTKYCILNVINICI